MSTEWKPGRPEDQNLKPEKIEKIGKNWGQPLIFFRIGKNWEKIGDSH
jgi:hypothetical protein